MNYKKELRRIKEEVARLLVDNKHNKHTPEKLLIEWDKIRTARIRLRHSSGCFCCLKKLSDVTK
jgi:hypothetical protein